MDTYTIVGSPESASVLKRAAVDGDTETNLGSSGTAGDIVFDCLVGRDTSASAAVQVGLVVSNVGPGAGVVIGLVDVGQSSHSMIESRN